MDILAHGLWTNIMYKSLPATRNDRKTVLWGILFGILPDLISFTPIFVVYFFGLILGRASVRFGPPDSTTALYSYALNSYNYTHSLVIWTAGLLLAWLILRRFPWVSLGWLLHILIDLFTHPDYFRTPFLFPLSNFHNPYAIS
ncbi:MAG: hypothetical protein KW788_02280, partial [Candidatus Doudnabacteria bacterium]|nr:hypothetical protein [Candidatus Doudnabacteria bacterium]